ncbi:MAG: glycoside hydrolase domain-containing protein, partial [bacterium]
FYAFQIGIYAVKSAIQNIAVHFEDLKSKDGRVSIPASELHCFNVGGIDWTGKTFKKVVSVAKGKVQPLWFGVQIPENIVPQQYEGKVAITPSGMQTQTIRIILNISNEVLADAGDSEPWRHSRLRWLDSKIALNNGIVPPYIPMQVKDHSVSCLGRTVKVAKIGFPASIQSMFSPEMTHLVAEGREILASPIRLVIESGEHKPLAWEAEKVQFVKQKEGAVAWESQGQAGVFHLRCSAQMEFDGNIDFQVTLTTAKSAQVQDIRLEIPLKRDVAEYMMGMGVKGGRRPAQFQWQWDVQHNQDAVWLGDVNAGLQCSFKDENYSRPLNTNFYHSKPLKMPPSWYNEGKGGVQFKETDKNTVLLTSYSGSRTIAKGEELHFNFSLLLTPFKMIDTDAQWRTRFYHRFKPLAEIARTGANTINVHHATDINPYINYPFLRPQEMKKYVDEAHERGFKVKIYYTVRELSNKAPELFALRSLGDEILSFGPGGGFSWLQEHLDQNYIAGWFVPRLQDAAIINSGVSRWHNYYLEGLNWLVKNVGIDGLYIDDVAFDRTVMKRVRKILDRGRKGALIDLHSANQFNVRDGFANSANLYLEHFPYLNRLWFGEYFDYDAPPDFWLIEISGIPFGLMGEMLQDGGNPWRGMIYGMTNRLPWAGDPRPIWKVWDDFGIQGSSMIGYWASTCPIKTDHKDVLATAYVKKDKTLISIASWVKEPVMCQLKLDWKTLGLDLQKAILVAPAVSNFQEKQSFAIHDKIPIDPARGWLLIVKEKKL